MDIVSLRRESLHAQPKSVPHRTHQRRARHPAKRAGAHTAPYWEVVRARIVLLAAEGTSNKEIAARLDTTPQTACKWRKRFYEEGSRGLEDRPRSGRPPTFSPPKRGWR